MFMIDKKSPKEVEYLRFFNEQLNLFREITNFNFSFVPADKRYEMLKSSHARPESEFCKCVQSDPEGMKRCCDEKRLSGILIQTHKPMVETCHAGLIDVFIPVFVEEELIGYFCFGKFLFNPPSEEHFQTVLDNIRDLNVDTGRLRREYFATRVLNKEYIDLLTQIFTPLANRIIHMELDIMEEKKRVEKLTDLLLDRNASTEIIGRSQQMGSIFDYLGKIKNSDGCVLIYGESGTGKELLAKYIHRNSQRTNKPFLTVNCASLSEHILESELFGHVKGAFSGAVCDRMGILETVDGGTLCLDEIGETTLSFQKKLLRAIEEKEIKPVGSNRIKKIDVRFIASTNKNLEKLVEQNKFREDLFYRLKVFGVFIPPLRERSEDVPVLLDHFLRLQSEKYGPKEMSLTRRAMETLMHYEWPGNVRELRNLAENLYFLADGAVTLSMIAGLLKIPPEVDPAGSEEHGNDFDAALQEFEKKYLLHELERFDWNVSETAKSLGRTREWLSRKIGSLRLREKYFTTPL
ncbi:sigma 54-interacting transcriptional regulator [bacterium]|nr:sigma 54-interacting transcriptional regulator [bacterium]